MNQTDEKQQFEEWIDDVQAVNQPMLCQHVRSRAVRKRLPGQRHRPRPGRPERDGVQPLHRHALLLEQLPVQGPPLQFLDYNKRPLTELKGPLYSTPLTHKTDGEWDLLRWWKDPNSGMRTEDEWDLIKLSKNPT
jgi:hypothetical protein